MVDNYIKRKEIIEQSSSVNKEEELKQAKTELVKKVDDFKLSDNPIYLL